MTSYTGRTISSNQWTEGYIDWRNNLSGSLSGNIPPPETESAMLALPPPELPTASVRSHAVAEKSSQSQGRRTVQTKSRRKFSDFHIPELKEGKKRGRMEGEAAERKEEAKKRK
ncbi:hypothetical protein Taro_032941, partial [Colocasia esculenta]|nr:hypothetical protein [Colocasia esculenta]